jgi:hypothetical protein
MVPCFVLRLSVAALACLVAGCAVSGAQSPERAAPTRAIDYRISQVGLTAVTVRLAVGANAELSDGERAALPGLYEGTLVDGLDSRALVVRDVRVANRRETLAAAVARARDVGADHAVVVEVWVEPDVVRVCEETRRPLQGRATVVKQQASLVRVSDGAVRSRVEVSIPAVEADCDGARPQVSSRSATATIAVAVDRLLARLLGP